MIVTPSDVGATDMTPHVSWTGTTPERGRTVRTWAAVPYRGESGKQRLSGLLSDHERVRVVVALLADVLGALTAVPPIERILVVAPNGVRLPSQLDVSVTLLPERSAVGSGQPAGLNTALVSAQQTASAEGADRLLVIPADLPLLTPEDVGALLSALPTSEARHGVVIAPDGTESGTNALLLSPPTALGPMFGMQSFSRHVAQAASRGLPCVIVRRPNLALDLDTPADVARLLVTGRAGQTLALARTLGLDERLGMTARGR